MSNFELEIGKEKVIPFIAVDSSDGKTRLTNDTIRFAFFRTDNFYIWDGSAWVSSAPAESSLPTGVHRGYGVYTYTIPSACTNTLPSGKSIIGAAWGLSAVPVLYSFDVYPSGQTRRGFENQLANIRNKTDLLQFDPSNYVKSTPQTAVTLSAGQEVQLDPTGRAQVSAACDSALENKGYTSVRAGYLDYLDAAISSIAQSVWNYATRTLTSFGTLISDIWSHTTRTLTSGTKDAEIDAIKAKTDKLSFDANNYVYSAPQVPVSAGVVQDKTGYGLTASERNEIASAVDSQLSTNHGSGSWEGGDGTSLTKQDVRDAMLLAPTSGVAPASGSVDQKLNDMPSQVDAQLTNSHGAGSWQQAGVAGSLAVKVILQDANTNPIADAVVTITSDQNGLNVVDSKSTNANGEAEFNLDAGTYYVRPRKTGWTFPVSTEWVIATNGDSITVQGSPVTHTAPSSDYGLLYGWLKDSRGNALANKEIKISLSRPATYNQEVLDKEFSVMTDENGYFEIALVGCDKVDNAQEKPLQYYIEVKEAGLGEYFTINGGETLSVSDI